MPDKDNSGYNTEATQTNDLGCLELDTLPKRMRYAASVLCEVKEREPWLGGHMVAMMIQDTASRFEKEDAAKDPVEIMARALHEADCTTQTLANIWDTGLPHSNKQVYRRRAEHLIADGWTKPE